MSERFMFFKNFKRIADGLPDDMRLKFYDALCDFVFEQKESDDSIIKSLITAIRPSLDHHQNWGGAREGSGRPKKNQDENLKNLEIQDNQDEKLEKKEKSSFSSLLETETETNKKNNTNVLLKKNQNLDWEYIKNRWNEIAKEWDRPAIKVINDDRKRKFAQRVREYGGQLSELFDEIEYRIATSLLLQGKQQNVHGEIENAKWGGCSFGFLCQAESFCRLLDGDYKDAGLERRYAIQKRNEADND